MPSADREDPSGPGRVGADPLRGAWSRIVDSERIELRDGSKVLVRAIKPGDKERLREGFEELSPQSRYRRFLTPKKRLTDDEVRYLTEVDHLDHEALVALEPENARVVGVARYIRSSDDPGAAEAAIAVIDPWQRRGMGSALMTRLADRAQAVGISRFTGTILADNAHAQQLLEHLGPARATYAGERGTAAFEVELSADARARLAYALRAAATGELRVLIRAAAAPVRDLREALSGVDWAAGGWLVPGHDDEPD